MTPLQLAIMTFALFAISRTFLRWRENQITHTEFTFWTIVWISITITVFQPWVTDWISQKFGIGRGIDFVVYITIVVLLYLIFRIYVRLEALEQDLTKLVSTFALQHPKKKKHI